jgi:hypothetical protein
MALFEIAEELKEQKEQLLNAKYMYHKLVWTRYKESMGNGMKPLEARKRYKVAMGLYNSIVNESIDELILKERQDSIDKGFV